MGSDQLPLEYLVTSSQTALEGFELSRLSQCANLRKELRQITDQWIEVEIEARMARWILECRRAQDSGANSPLPDFSTPASNVALACEKCAEVTPAKSAKARSVRPRARREQRRLQLISSQNDAALPLIPVFTLDSETPPRVVPTGELFTRSTGILPHGEAALRLLEQFVQFRSTSFGARSAKLPASSRRRSLRSVVTLSPPREMRPGGPVSAPLRQLSIARRWAAPAS
jgi:hypothetical protein